MRVSDFKTAPPLSWLGEDGTSSLLSVAEDSAAVEGSAGPADALGAAPSAAAAVYEPPKVATFDELPK